MSDIELEQARRDLDERTFKVEYEAEFTNYEGVVNYAFDRSIHIDEINFQRPQQIIHIGVDFNVNPMTAVCFVYQDGHFYFIDEMELFGSNTDELCQEDFLTQKYLHILMLQPNLVRHLPMEEQT